MSWFTIHNELRKWLYENPPIIGMGRNETSENFFSKGWTFSGDFFHLLYKKRWVPRWNEYRNFLISRRGIGTGQLARASRAWNSFVREFDLLATLNMVLDAPERTIYAARSTNLDINFGVDIVLTDKKLKALGLASFQATRRAVDFRDDKGKPICPLIPLTTTEIFETSGVEWHLHSQQQCLNIISTYFHNSIKLYNQDFINEVYSALKGTKRAHDRIMEIFVGNNM